MSRIPNRFVIHPVPFLILAPISVISVLFTRTSSTSNIDSFQLLLVSTLSYGIFCLVLLIYKVLYINRKRESDSPILGIALVALIAGFIKGSFTTLCLDQLSKSNNTNNHGLARSLSAAVITTIGVTSLTYLDFEIHRLRDLRKARITALIEFESRRMLSDSAVLTLVSSTRKHVEDGLRSTLTELLDSIEDPSIDSHKLDLALSQLARASENQLQSLTNQLQQKLEMEFPRLTWGNLFKLVLTPRSFPAVPLSLLIMLSSIGFIVQNDASKYPLLRILVIGVCSFLSLALGNFCMAKIETFSSAVWMSTVILCAITPFLAGILFLGDSFIEVLNNFYAYVVLLVGLSSLACLINGFVYQRRRIDVDLLASLDLSRVQERATSEINRRLLKDMIDFIHGQVQSRLMAAAMAISSAKDADDQDKLTTEFIALRNLAEAPFERFETYRSLSLDSAMNILIHTWQDLLQITLEQDFYLMLKGLDAFKVSSIVEEGLLNAYRHGHAITVHISAERNDSQIALIMKDDGVGPLFGPANLGSALFDSTSVSWTLSSGPDGIGAELKLILT